MLCGSEKGIRSIVAAKASGVTARLCLGSSRGPFVDYVIGYQTDSIAACLRRLFEPTAFGNLVDLNWSKAQLLCQMTDFGAAILVVARNENDATGGILARQGMRALIACPRASRR
jgi:hypothetical protein